MDEPRQTEAHGAVDRLATRLGASRQEAVGLAVLLCLAGLFAVVLWWWQRPSGVVDHPGDRVAVAMQNATIIVHVTGAVRTPGVVSIQDGSRVVDALALAGGAASDADLAGLNLARLVVDGEQIVVPRVRSGPQGAGDPDVSASSSVRDGEGRINLNRATAQDLQELPGVGPVLAQRIIQHRDANGPFMAPGDLRGVTGIGEKTFQAIAPLIWV